jgi:O-antigen ligase
MFEPLLFFVLTYSNNILGIPISISRILQMVVLSAIGLSFVFKLKNNDKVILVNNLLPENKFLLLYFILLIFSAFIGIIFGSYDLPEDVNANNFGGNPYLDRSLFEYFILLFNIIYFVILPSQLIKTKTDFNYLFSVFKFFLIVTLIIGYVDYALSELDVIDLVSRHIRDGVQIGGRFHGLGGEPRQAAVHMVFNFSMYILYCKFFNIKFNLLIIFLLVLSLLLTTSTSLFFGLIIFFIFLVFFRIIKFSYLLILLSVIILMFNNIYIQNYFNHLKDAWQIIDSGIELPYFLRITRGEFYPIYDFIIKIQNFELITVFFGNGLGSVSAINNMYIGEYLGSRNPNSQLTRTLFEAGALGTIVYIASMVWPVKYFTSDTDKKSRELYLTSMLMVLAVTFAVRSPIVFLYLGIITSFLKYNKKKLIL